MLANKQTNLTDKFNDVQINFPDDNADKFRTFYSQSLLHRNLNFIPLKVDW